MSVPRVHQLGTVASADALSSARTLAFFTAVGFDDRQAVVNGGGMRGDGNGTTGLFARPRRAELMRMKGYDTDEARLVSVTNMLFMVSTSDHIIPYSRVGALLCARPREPTLSLPLKTSRAHCFTGFGAEADPDGASASTAARARPCHSAAPAAARAIKRGRCHRARGRGHGVI